MKYALLGAAAAGVIAFAGNGASAQTYLVERTYAPPVYEVAPPVYEVAPPTVITTAPVYAPPGPVYHTVIPARAVPEVVVTEPSWHAGPGVVYADW